MKDIKFVAGFPKGVYVGQTTVDFTTAIDTDQPHLAGFNLALHVNDDRQRVQQHRMQLLELFRPYGVKQLTWLNQTHSTICHSTQQLHFFAQNGDALCSREQGNALMIMTADCLPIVLCDETGTEIANLHAGWRGLVNGMIENTIAQMQRPAHYAYIGVAISQKCFEVGQEVKDIFIQHYPNSAQAFIAGTEQGKYYADLYTIARMILQQQGVKHIMGGESCSYSQAEYYSYRRNSQTGRMATFVFMGNK